MDDSPIAYSVIYTITKRGLIRDYIKLEPSTHIDTYDFIEYFNDIKLAECVCHISLSWSFYRNREDTSEPINVIASTRSLDHRADRTTPKLRSACATCDQSDYSTTFEFWCDNYTTDQLEQPNYCTTLERLLEPAVHNSFHWVNLYPPDYYHFYP